MTIHVISVGINLLEGFFKNPAEYDRREVGPGIRHAKPSALLKKHVGDSSKDASDLLYRILSPIPPSEIREDVEECVATVQVTQWPAKASPELDTFDRALGSKRVPLEDVAVLVATDTIEGLTAAFWNAVALADGDLSRICYLADPKDRPNHIRGKVLIVRVPGLDAMDERGFRTAMRGLGHLGRNLFHHQERKRLEDFKFYLSGGFKAAIPYLIGLAEGLRSLPSELNVGDVQAYVLHETTQADPIRLPLRRMSAEMVRCELNNFDSKGYRRSRCDGLLEGYAYDYEEGENRCRLTAFGEGLRELFGLPHEGVGG